MCIPDPIERMEASADRWAEEYMDGDEFVCGCGKRCKLIDGETIDPIPYAIPCCPDCFEIWFKSQEKNK